MTQPERSGSRSLARTISSAPLKQLAVPTGTASNAEHIRLVTAHCTVVAVDIEEFGRYSRNNLNQVRIRHGLYRAMQDAFDSSGIPWSACYHEDRGDGVLVLAQADVPKALFVERLPDALTVALIRHNRIHPASERIRLRLALHAGEINYDEHGVTGSAINHTFRLLNADTFVNALAGSSAVLAIIGSTWFFDEVIRHSESSRMRSYRPAEIRSKETATQGWIRLLTVRGTARRSTRYKQADGASAGEVAS
jgi:hypothetical protein